MIKIFNYYTNFCVYYCLFVLFPKIRIFSTCGLVIERRGGTLCLGAPFARRVFR